MSWISFDGGTTADIADGGTLLTLQFELLTAGQSTLSWSTVPGDNEYTDI